jgi:hypothetical protein
MGSITRSFANLITANGPSAVADGSVTTGDISGNINFRNIIINGDMSIAQRGTSTSGVASGNTFPCVDRFTFEPTGMGTWTVSQDTDVPSGQGFAKSMKIDCTSADASPSTGDLLQIMSKYEGQNLQYLKYGTANAESVTMSFWVKSNKTGTYVVNIYSPDSVRLIGGTYTINSSNTWEKKTITFAGDTISSLDNDNNTSFQIHWILGTGSDYTSGTLRTTWTAYTNGDYATDQTVNLADSTANNFWITGVQLEAGTTASDFEFLPYDVNFKRCLRYYWRTDQYLNKTGYYAKFGGAGGVFLERIPFPVPMRTNPSYTHGNGSNNNVSLRQDSSVQNFTIQSNEGNSTQGLNMTIYNGGGGLSWTEGNAYSCLIYNLQCNSEL